VELYRDRPRGGAGAGWLSGLFEHQRFSAEDEQHTREHCFHSAGFRPIRGTPVQNRSADPTRSEAQPCHRAADKGRGSSAAGRSVASGSRRCTSSRTQPRNHRFRYEDDQPLQGLRALAAARIGRSPDGLRACIGRGSRHTGRDCRLRRPCPRYKPTRNLTKMPFCRKKRNLRVERLTPRGWTPSLTRAPGAKPISDLGSSITVLATIKKLGRDHPRSAEKTHRPLGRGVCLSRISAAETKRHRAGAARVCPLEGGAERQAENLAVMGTLRRNARSPSADRGFESNIARANSLCRDADAGRCDDIRMGRGAKLSRGAKTRASFVAASEGAGDGAVLLRLSGVQCTATADTEADQRSSAECHGELHPSVVVCRERVANGRSRCLVGIEGITDPGASQPASTSVRRAAVRHDILAGKAPDAGESDRS
jgi:hypothetical protein